MELNVAQPRLGNAVQVRGRDDAAKGARHAVALVVGHDEQHVGRALGRHNARRPPGRGILGGFLDYAAEFRRRWRKLLSVDGGRGVGLTQRARDLLRIPGRHGHQRHQKNRSQAG